MNELETARAIAGGGLESPQQCGGMWLFALRMTGTGLSFRPKHGEYVFRKPEHYLNEEFMDRCAGLPVIWEHPENDMLEGVEYGDRAVGAVMFAYQNESDIWCIARIQDAGAAMEMKKGKLTTSPCLTLENKRNIEDERLNHPLLIEGEPLFLDHLAIVPTGVWDKGGEPSGILTRADSMEPEAVKTEETQPTLGDVLKAIMALTQVMTKHEKTEEVPVKADAVVDPLDAVGDPEAGEGQSEQKPEVVPVADAEHDKPENTVGDCAMPKADSSTEMAGLKARLAQLEKAAMPSILSDADRNELAAIKMRADSAYSAFGLSAPASTVGEKPHGYRRRLLDALKKHSAAWKSVDLSKIADPMALEIAEGQIYADAVTASTSIETIGAGKLREVSNTDHGSTVTKYYGDSRAFLGMFMRQPLVGKFNKQGDR